MASSVSDHSVPAAIAQTESPNSDRASVGIAPTFRSPAAAKSPTPSISSFFSRIRSPVISPSSSIAPSRVSSHAPSIGPAAHAGRACEDVDEESRLNKEMTQEMNSRLMDLENEVEALRKCINQRDAGLKLMADSNTKNEGDFQQLEEQCSSLRNELDLSYAQIEELQAICGDHEELSKLSKSYQADIARLESCILDMEDKLAELTNQSLLDGQTVETMTDEIADLKESHKSEITGLEQELVKEQNESRRKSLELKQKVQDLQDLKAQVEQDNETASTYPSNEALLEKLAFAEDEVETLNCRIEKLEEARETVQKKHIATLEAERERIEKAKNDLNALKEACHVHQGDLALKVSEAENLRTEISRGAELATAELNNTRLEFDVKLKQKDDEINKVKTELAAKKDFMLKLISENATLKDDNESLSGTLWNLKEYADIMAAAEEEQEKESTLSRSSNPRSSSGLTSSSRQSKPKNKGTSHIKAENKELKGKLNELAAESEEKKAMIAGLKAELEKLKDQLANASPAPKKTVPTNHQVREKVSIGFRGFDNPFFDTIETLA